MSSQGIMSSKKANHDPGLCPSTGQKSGLALKLGPKINSWSCLWVITKTYLLLKVHDKGAPLHFPQQCPNGERYSVSRAHGLFIHFYLSDSPGKESSHKSGENVWSLSTEPHVDGRPIYNGVQPGSPRKSFMTLLSLPQGHAAFSMIPSTLAWVDQSPVSQCVS